MNQYLNNKIFKISSAFGRKNQKWNNFKLFNKTQFYNEEEFNAFQNKRLQQLLKVCNTNITYYRELFIKNGIQVDSINVNNFNEIPLLTKEIIKAEKDNLLNKNIDPGRVRLNSTSGSSGNKTIFYSDVDSELIKAALVKRALTWLDINIGDKELRIWGAMHDVNKARTLINRMKNFASNYKVISSYKLNDEIIENYIALINKYKPDQIHAYPSSIYEISNKIIDKKFNVYSPKAILTSGEQLYEWQRDVIKKAFNADVFSFYGCREVNITAQECKTHEGLHIMAENIILEVVNEKGENVFDEEGEIVVTDLSNYVFPFIRYKNLDRGVLTREKCSCGRNLPLLKSISGRTFDLIKLKNGASVGATFFTHLFREKPGIDDFRIYQDEINKIKVEYISSDNNLDTSFFINQISQQSDNLLEIEFSKVDDFKTPDSGKKQFIFSKV